MFFSLDPSLTHHCLILIQGDWKKHHGANKDLLYVIEPVIESLLQLLVQSILVYVVLGPSGGEDNWRRTAAGEESFCEEGEVLKKTCAQLEKLRFSKTDEFPKGERGGGGILLTKKNCR